jgi:DNA-binding MarR family transcriptional regulator
MNVISLSDADRSAMSSFGAALKPLGDMARALQINLNIALVETLLLVAMNPDRSIGELAKSAGVANGTMSQWLSDLSEINRSGAPRLGLITQKTYLYDRWHTRNRLSVKGQAFVRQIAGAMNGLVRVAA